MRVADAVISVLMVLAVIQLVSLFTLHDQVLKSLFGKITWEETGEDDFSIESETFNWIRNNGNRNERININKKWTKQTTAIEASRSKGLIPNILLAGAQKAGTTALADYIFGFNVCRPAPQSEKHWANKETHFFDTLVFHMGLPFYQSRYAHCGDDVQFAMDATPETMLFPNRVRHIYDQHGAAEELKIIFSLREPVAREISWYQNMVREAQDENPAHWSDEVLDGNGNFRTFADYTATKLSELDHTRNAYVRRGFYAYWLRRWFHYFDRHQILILHYDDFKANQTDVLLRIHEFLRLPVTGNLTAPRSNSEHVETLPIDCTSQKLWAKRFERPNQELYALLEAHPGPPMEKRPFKHFQFRCYEK